MKNYSFILFYLLLANGGLLNLVQGQNIQNINKQTVIDNNTNNKRNEAQIVFINNDLIPYDSSIKFSDKKAIPNNNIKQPKINNEEVIEIYHPLIPFEERQAYYQEKKMNPFMNQNEVVNLSPQPLKPYYPKNKE